MDHKGLADIYYSHIPKERKIMPNNYWDNIPDINNGNIYAKNGLPNCRDINRQDYFRIGDCVLSIPPELIQVSVESQKTSYPRLREKHSTNVKSGYSNKEIVITFKVNGINQINGFKIEGPTGHQYIDGLRPLIAQIKKTPFLPIENYVMNIVHDIHTITVKGVSITTVPDFPGMLQCQLILYEFNSKPFTTLPDEAFIDIIEWDVFRWYYQQTVNKLTPIKDIYSMDEFVFGLIDEALLYDDKSIQDKNDPDIIDKNIIDIAFSDDMYMTDMTVGVGSVFKDIQMSDYNSPVTQYFGNTSNHIVCSFETSNDDNVIALKSMYDTAERYAREYRNRTAQGFIKFENPLAMLFGIEYVIIDSLIIETVEDTPGLYSIRLIMTSFDKTQVSSSIPRGISPTDGKGDISDLLSNAAIHSYRESKHNAIVEKTLDSMDLYPDLDLPTYNEYVNGINAINSFRISKNLNELNMNKRTLQTLPNESDILRWNGTKYVLQNEGQKDKKIEPDFYFHYPSLEQTGLDQLLDGNEDFKNATDKVDKYLNQLQTGISEVDTPIINPKQQTYTNTSNGSLRDAWNPTYNDIINHIKIVANKNSIPVQLALATAWTESNMTHYRKDGQIYAGANPTSTDWGIMQINDKAWPDAFTGKVNVKNSWKYNIEYSLEKILKEAYNKAVSRNEGVLGKAVFTSRTIESCLASAAYSGYNAGSAQTWRFRTKRVDASNKNPYSTLDRNGYDARDANFYSFYSTSPWKKYETATDVNQSDMDRSNFFASPIANKIGSSLKISSPFGPRVHPKTGVAGTMHNGIDISEPTGVEVIAVKPGKIKFADFQDKTDLTKGYGLYVKIDHEDGSQTLYAHLSSVNVKINEVVLQGTVIGKVGNTGSSTGSHLHFEVIKSGKPVDPKNYIIGQNGFSVNGHNNQGQVFNNVDLSGGITTKKMPEIDFNALGKPQRKLIGSAFINSRAGLIERMLVDYMEYNKRGTMLRAFPSFAVLFVDEGMWMDGRRLWSNYYLYNSIIDITIEKDRRKPADTAVLNMTNIYNSLGINPKVRNENNSFYRKLLESVELYTDEIIGNIIDNKNHLLSSFNVEAGARVHVRMGYGNSASRLPIAFNGTVTEINTNDVVTIIAQGDGIELTQSVVGVDEEDSSTGWWDIGAEPHRIITYLLTERSKPFLSRYSNGAWGETSRFGIEHFGNFYFGKDLKQKHIKFSELMAKNNKTASLTNKFLFDIFYNPYYDIYDPTLGIASAVDQFGRTMIEWIAPSGSAIEAVLTADKVDDYDIMKNIYIADLELSKENGKNVIIGKTNSGKEYNRNWWLYNPESTVSLYTFNKTPWDLCKSLAAMTPEFICHPHEHEFRSTLFFGLPQWNVRYKYEYITPEEIYEYAKPYSQAHILSSTYDIIDNQIVAKAPEITFSSSTYNTPKGDQKSTSPVYADRDIKSELQKLSIVDSGMKWALTGVETLDDFADTLPVSFLSSIITGEDFGEEEGRRVSINAVQNSFREMYDGSLLILGDASIKPYDVINIEDSYINMHGTAEVRKVVYHMGVNTGFVTEITPDLCVAQNDVETDRMHIQRAIGSLATGFLCYWRRAKLIDRMLKVTRKTLGLVEKGTSKVKSWRTTNKAIELYKAKYGKYAGLAKEASTVAKARIANNASLVSAMKSKNGLRAVRLGTRGISIGMTGIRQIGNLAKAIRVALLAPSATGVGIVVTIIGIILFEIIWRMFSGIINYFRDSNVIKIYPLWLLDKPYVAGISGHKNLIPGYTDEMLKLNYKSNSSYQELNDFYSAISNLPEEQQAEIIDELGSTKTSTETLNDVIKMNWIRLYKHIPWTRQGKQDLELMRVVFSNDSDYEESKAVTIKPIRNSRIIAESKLVDMNQTKTFRPLAFPWQMFTQIDGNKIITKFGVAKAEYLTGYNVMTAPNESAPVFAFADGKVVSVVVSDLFNTKMAKNRGAMETLIDHTTGLYDETTDEVMKMVRDFTPWVNGNTFNSSVTIEHNNISIDGKTKFYTVYHNLTTFNVVKGDTVIGGECIGSCGHELSFLTEANSIFSDNHIPMFMIIGAGSNTTTYDPRKWIWERNEGDTKTLWELMSFD